MAVITKDRKSISTTSLNSRILRIKHTPSKNRDIVKLTQTVRKLSDVEKELIRRISKFPIDTSTEKLIAELQIYTNRISKQLQDISQE